MQHIARILSSSLTPQEAKMLDACSTSADIVDFAEAKALADLKLIEKCALTSKFKLTVLGNHVYAEQRKLK